MPMRAVQKLFTRTASSWVAPPQAVRVGAYKSRGRWTWWKPDCRYGLYEMGTELEIEILGELYKATVIEESPCDPQNEKLRA
jgi:hypothetical protein